MDCGHLVYLAVCPRYRVAGLAIALLWDVASFSQRHVCLHLAFL